MWLSILSTYFGRQQGWNSCKFEPFSYSVSFPLKAFWSVFCHNMAQTSMTLLSSMYANERKNYGLHLWIKCPSRPALRNIETRSYGRDTNYGTSLNGSRGLLKLGWDVEVKLSYSHWSHCISAPLQFGNAYVISSHTLCWLQLLIHPRLKVIHGSKRRTGWNVRKCVDVIFKYIFLKKRLYVSIQI